MFLILTILQSKNAKKDIKPCLVGSWKISQGSFFHKNSYNIKVSQKDSQLQVVFNGKQIKGTTEVVPTKIPNAYLVFYKHKPIANISFVRESKCNFYTSSFTSLSNIKFILDWANNKGKFYFTNSDQNYQTFDLHKNVNSVIHAFLVSFFFGTLFIYAAFRIFLIVTNTTEAAMKPIPSEPRFKYFPLHKEDLH